MDYHTRLAERVRKAKSTKVTTIRPNYVKVKGSENGYTVMVKRVGNTLLVDCSNDDTGEMCKAQRYHSTVCYHGLKTALELSKAKGYGVSFCVSREHAELLSRIGGQVLRVKSGHGKQGELWMVAQKVQKVDDWRAIQLEEIEEAIKVQEAKLEQSPWSMRAQKGLNHLVAGREALKAQLGE